MCAASRWENVVVVVALLLEKVEVAREEARLTSNAMVEKKSLCVESRTLHQNRAHPTASARPSLSDGTFVRCVTLPPLRLCSDDIAVTLRWYSTETVGGTGQSGLKRMDPQRLAMDPSPIPSIPSHP